MYFLVREHRNHSFRSPWPILSKSDSLDQIRAGMWLIFSLRQWQRLSEIISASEYVALRIEIWVAIMVVTRWGCSQAEMNTQSYSKEGWYLMSWQKAKCQWNCYTLNGWLQQIFLSLTVIFNIQHFKSHMELGLGIPSRCLGNKAFTWHWLKYYWFAIQIN